MAAKSLPGFIHIGPRTSLYTPESPRTGQLVILCTWLGAGRRPIGKYVDLYQQIAPGARILLIESEVSILISSYVRQRREIQSAVSAVSDTLAECDHKFTAPEKASDVDATSGPIEPKILLQTFSNGGTNTATQLLHVLQERLQKPLPLAGLVCDSGPAKGTYWKSYDAMVLSLPKSPATQIVGAVACHCILLLLYSWIAWGNENPSSLQRRTLLSNKYVWGTVADDGGAVQTTANGEGRVCYLYSKADRMCQWTDVMDHAVDAREKGWQVEEINFEDSAHCGHYLKYDVKYADAIRSIWQGTGPTWTYPLASKM